MYFGGISLAVILIAVLVGVLISILAIVLAVLVGILIFVLIGVFVLVLILIIHHKYLLRCLRKDACLGCPFFYDLSFALKNKLARSPAKIAAVMPPAAADNPPVKIPRNPSVLIDLRTPFAR